MDKIKPFDLPLQLQLELENGSFTPFADFYERRLSQMSSLFSDQTAVAVALQSSDPLLYDVRSRPFVTSLSDLSFGITRIYPGKVGEEYYMTRGHYHILVEQPEIYLCLRGQGCLLLESGEGDFQAHWWVPGSLSHIPPGYAHRTVNVASEPLVFAAIYHLSAVHDYAGIAQHGFLHLVVERDGKPVLIPNKNKI
jgi:glucose-6-phosphate isomerase